MRSFRAAACSGVAVVGLLLFAACASSETPAAASKPAADAGTKPAMSTDLEHGMKLYAQYCSPCHGEKGEGAAMAEAVAGRTEQQVLKQVRTPKEKMPAFSIAQISDVDLGHIAQAVASMPRPSMPAPGVPTQKG